MCKKFTLQIVVIICLSVPGGGKNAVCNWSIVNSSVPGILTITSRGYPNLEHVDECECKFHSSIASLFTIAVKDFDYKESESNKYGDCLYGLHVGYGSGLGSQSWAYCMHSRDPIQGLEATNRFFLQLFRTSGVPPITTAFRLEVIYGTFQRGHVSVSCHKLSGSGGEEEENVTPLPTRQANTARPGSNANLTTVPRETDSSSTMGPLVPTTSQGEGGAATERQVGDRDDDEDDDEKADTSEQKMILVLGLSIPLCVATVAIAIGAIVCFVIRKKRGLTQGNRESHINPAYASSEEFISSGDGGEYATIGSSDKDRYQSVNSDYTEIKLGSPEKTQENQDKPAHGTISRVRKSLMHALYAVPHRLRKKEPSHDAKLSNQMPDIVVHESNSSGSGVAGPNVAVSRKTNDTISSNVSYKAPELPGRSPNLGKKDPASYTHEQHSGYSEKKLEAQFSQQNIYESVTEDPRENPVILRNRDRKENAVGKPGKNHKHDKPGDTVLVDNDIYNTDCDNLQTGEDFIIVDNIIYAGSDCD